MGLEHSTGLDFSVFAVMGSCTWKVSQTAKFQFVWSLRSLTFEPLARYSGLLASLRFQTFAFHQSCLSTIPDDLISSSTFSGHCRCMQEH